MNRHLEAFEKAQAAANVAFKKLREHAALVRKEARDGIWYEDTGHGYMRVPFKDLSDSYLKYIDLAYSSEDGLKEPEAEALPWIEQEMKRRGLEQ